MVPEIRKVRPQYEEGRAQNRNLNSRRETVTPSHQKPLRDQYVSKYTPIKDTLSTPFPAISGRLTLRAQSG
jgi:hypothetical protein